MPGKNHFPKYLGVKHEKYVWNHHLVMVNFDPERPGVKSSKINENHGPPHRSAVAVVEDPGQRSPNQLEMRAGSGTVGRCADWNVLPKCHPLAILLVTFLVWWKRDPFKILSDLQIGDQKVTLNHLAYHRCFNGLMERAPINGGK